MTTCVQSEKAADLKTWPFSDVEPRWQARWEACSIFHAEPRSDRPN